MKRHLKVLLSATAADGAWRYSVDLARGLSALGHETVLAVMGPPVGLEAQVEAMRIPGLRLIDTGHGAASMAEGESELAETAEALAALAAEVRADIVQLRNPALAALASFPAPVVALHQACVATWWDAVHRSELPSEFALRTERLRRGLVAADAVVTPTAAFAAAVQRRYDLPQMPRAVHTGRVPRALGSGAPHDFVFTAGPLWDQGRNFGTLDAAVGGIGVPVRAAGPVRGPGGARVLFDNIDCLGALGEEELGRWLAARPVFVSTALYEPAGRAVLDAASAGCALILSDIPSFRELWDHVAVFVDPRDEEGYTRAIASLVADDFERAVMGRGARERAARYTPDAMAAQMAWIYRGLLPAVSGPVLAAARAA